MATTSDADAPRCPSCSYELTGLEALTCPECGTALERDFSRYRPSARPSPWSAGRGWWFWKRSEERRVGKECRARWPRGVYNIKEVRVGGAAGSAAGRRSAAAARRVGGCV